MGWYEEKYFGPDLLVRNVEDGPQAPLRPLGDWIRIWEAGPVHAPPPGFSKPMQDAQPTAAPASQPADQQQQELANAHEQARQQQMQQQQMLQQHEASQYGGYSMQQQPQHMGALGGQSFLAQLQGHGGGPSPGMLPPPQLPQHQLQQPGSEHMQAQGPYPGHHHMHAQQYAQASQQQSFPQQQQLPPQQGGYGEGGFSEAAHVSVQAAPRPRLPLFERLGGGGQPAPEAEQDSDLSQYMHMLRQPVRILFSNNIYTYIHQSENTSRV